MNSATTMYALLLSITTAVTAISFWRNTTALLLAFGLFVAAYLVLYFSLVRFKAPQQLSLRGFWDNSEIRVPRSATRKGGVGSANRPQTAAPGATGARAEGSS